ncbi:MAG TPA: hypothetical protein DC046_05360 [Rhodospirillaceae bacterium]|nr:hypothetical protein [Rhodospirillaceae bacterium]|tara:strand:- start:294 stop:557 length:264 start_codon:yes stop_codon:yes gene_type:complete
MASSSTTTQTADRSVARPGLFPLGQALASLTVSATQAVFNFPTILVKWQKRYEMRRHLDEMTPQLLADVGLTRADVRREVEKPFWIS